MTANTFSFWEIRITFAQRNRFHSSSLDAGTLSSRVSWKTTALITPVRPAMYSQLEIRAGLVPAASNAPSVIFFERFQAPHLHRKPNCNTAVIRGDALPPQSQTRRKAHLHHTYNGLSLKKSGARRPFHLNGGIRCVNGGDRQGVSIVQMDKT